MPSAEHRGQSVRLATFIEQNAEAVVSSAEEFCGTLLPAAGHLGSAALRDHLPKILDAIVKDLRQAQTPQEALRKSRGGAPLISDAPETAAQTHAMLRAQSGFDIGQMVSEYRALRASVLRLWQAQGSSLDAEFLVDIQRFNEAIDQALAESVSHFSAEAERWRNIFLAVLGHDLRGPLNAVLLTAELLSRIGSGEPTTEYTARLIRSGKRMKALLDSLLDYSRSSLGRGIAIQRTRASTWRPPARRSWMSCARLFRTTALTWSPPAWWRERSTSPGSASRWQIWFSTRLAMASRGRRSRCCCQEPWGL